jgi:hypothetical protein
MKIHVFKGYNKTNPTKHYSFSTIEKLIITILKIGSSAETLGPSQNIYGNTASKLASVASVVCNRLTLVDSVKIKTTQIKYANSYQSGFSRNYCFILECLKLRTLYS